LRAVGYDVKLFQYNRLGEICFGAQIYRDNIGLHITRRNKKSRPKPAERTCEFFLPDRHSID